MPAPEVRVIGFGMGPQHLTREASEALAGCDYVVALAKRPDDELVAVRRAVAEEYDVPLVVLDDPERDRAPDLSGEAYRAAVAAWHRAREAAVRAAIEERGGVAGILVWGDPSLYDSTLRVVAGLGLDYRVWPGISAPQLLAARHRIVLHEVGQPVLVTTARRLAEAVAAGHDNIVVMLTSGVDLEGLDDWTVWWGANLGRPEEQLLSGRVGDVLADLRSARESARAEAGWVMDLFLLRRCSGG